MLPFSLFFYKKKFRLRRRNLFENFLFSVDPLSTVPVYAYENGSTKSTLFLNNFPV